MPKPPWWQDKKNEDIVPLPTWWRGRRYNGRVEARWHVLFELLGIRTMFEPEGFRFADGLLYCPDLFIPQLKVWAEIKPADLDEVELRKVDNLVQATKYPCLELVGQPAFRTYTLKGKTWERQVILDVDWDGRRALNRGLLVTPSAPLRECDYTPRYTRAVEASSGEKFYGRKLPDLGREPFNISEEEMDAAWSGCMRCPGCGTGLRLLIDEGPALSNKREDDHRSRGAR